MSTAKSKLDAYLTLVSSGLESVTIRAIKDSLYNYTCHVKQLDSQVSEDELNGIKEKVLQQNLKIRNKRKQQQLERHSIYDAKVFGTCKLDNVGKEINIGFHEDKSIVSNPGALEGKRIIQFDTDAPPEMVATIREMGCGPLLALVATSRNENYSELVGTNKSLEDSIKAVTSFVDSLSAEPGKPHYADNFGSALKLWARHAEKVWFHSKDVQNHLASRGIKMKRKWNVSENGILDGNNCCATNTKEAIDNLRRKIGGESQIKYRISCIRDFTKDYKYRRDELTPHLASILIPQVVKDGDIKKFVVDLENYDFELVAIIKGGQIFVSISLNYYQYVGARSFCGGKVPPDITEPYIRGEISKDVIRLRPSIASLLYRLCKIKTGDIVVDPCAGVGTIPIEGSLKKCFAFGGDLVLCDDFTTIASEYSKAARCYQKDTDCIGGFDLISWDACVLPLRDGSVDVIISDLPFGVKCLSSNKLKAFLPLLFAECGRCLRKSSGRMVLLCGSFTGILEALQELSTSGKNMFENPSTIMPVNVGGLSAWIILVSRTSSEFASLANGRRRISNMIKGRSQSMHGAKKRVQA